MPIYEYKCPNGHLFEARHGMMEPSPEVCEVCGEGPLVRVLHPVAVHYKGSGFYSTDYGKGSRKGAKDGGKDGGSDGGSGSGSEKSDKGSGSSDKGSGSSDSGSGSGSGSVPAPVSGSSDGGSGGKKGGDS